MMSGCIVLDELVVKVNEARELAKLALSGGSREIVDDWHFLLQRTNAVAVNVMSQTLGWVDED